VPRGSLALVNGGMALCIFMAPVIIARISAKVAIVVGACCYW
jgi:hypothetical protein